jgi:lipopolysaccharide export system protein LptA
MSKNTIIQLLLFFILIILGSYVFYNFSKNKEENNLNILKKNENNNIDEKKLSNNQNIIENIRYQSSNFRGDTFEILAKYGETFLENPNQMKLTKVNSNILFKNGEIINLKSNFADFNTQTFETTFFENVSIIKKNEIIKGDKLYFMMEASNNISDSSNEKEENIIRLTGNVIYKKPGYTAKADIIEIDLVTKNLIIEMTKKTDRVVINTNNN